MRYVQTEAEVEQFKDGIVRFMSNFSIYMVKQQYLDNKEMFDNHAYNIHDHDEDAEEVEASPVDDDDDRKENTKEEDAAKFPFF